MRPRIAFVLEQALGHVAYGLALRRCLADRQDFEAVWLDVPFEPAQMGAIPKALTKNWTLRGSARAYRAIAAARKRAPLDALFIHTQTIGLFSAGHMAEVPTLLSLDATPINYDDLAHFYGDAVHPGPVERAKRFAHRSVMRRPKSFTVWSRWAKESLIKDYLVPADRITVIHPGADLTKFPDPLNRAPRRPGPLRVLFVGGDFKRKGGDLLLELFRSSFRGRLELYLVTGAEIAPEDGIFVYRGVKPYSAELMRLYADSDVFVLPTRGDCLAVVLGEAMASSLPIVTTRVGAHAEAVEDGASGFVIDIDDSAALADRLERLVADPEGTRAMGARARAFGEERFNAQKNADQIAAMLLDIARR